MTAESAASIVPRRPVTNAIRSGAALAQRILIFTAAVHFLRSIEIDRERHPQATTGRGERHLEKVLTAPWICNAS
jgi:hypothetical protein